MSKDQRTMLFAMLQRIARATRADANELRAEITVQVFGGPRSWATFRDPEVDRMKVALQLRLDDLDLNASIADEQYRAHDAAQAAHVPTVRPGQAQQRRKEPRRWASRYERETAVDDPGRRRRLVYWISRLFAPPYIRRVAGDQFGTTDWQGLPLPQLMLLKDTLKSRLSKWLTKHKEKHDFGFSIASRNPRSTTGLLTNEEVIAELLERGICLDLSATVSIFRRSIEEVKADTMDDMDGEGPGEEQGWDDHFADAGKMVLPAEDDCPF